MMIKGEGRFGHEKLIKVGRSVWMKLGKVGNLDIVRGEAV